MELHERSAMIFAAGLGKRMRPLTNTCPKPLLKVAGRSFLERALAHVSTAGIKNPVVNAYQFQDLVKDTLVPYPNVQISYEEDLLETGGGAKKALPLLGNEAFFTLNGDVVWRTSNLLQPLHDHWDGKKMDALLLLTPTAKAFGSVGRGDFSLNEDGTLHRYEGQDTSYMYNGCQLIHPRLFEGTEDIFSMNVLFEKALQKGRLHGLVLEGEWYHLSTPEDLETWGPHIEKLENGDEASGGRL